jgi:hypothetical protein
LATMARVNATRNRLSSDCGIMQSSGSAFPRSRSSSRRIGSNSGITRSGFPALAVFGLGTRKRRSRKSTSRQRSANASPRRRPPKRRKTKSVRKCCFSNVCKTSDAIVAEVRARRVDWNHFRRLQ